ncbi:type II toxin-antitoxin system Phd/YefM family antitoxin [Nocardia carnea]|uniref:type II toxin-antitoxin system Phd/YefM family antitoxin n=1 Tax=Nocardia carnea TaxID=37328 RepID=UPI0024572328|nr:type II toxin-antitoxin system Phd/YefM family antitoxin [Nocardia carnea]
MEIIPISEAKVRIAELVDKAAREHDSYTITRNGRADAVILSMAEYESMRETLDILADREAVADIAESEATEEYSTSEEIAELMKQRRDRHTA